MAPSRRRDHRALMDLLPLDPNQTFRISDDDLPPPSQAIPGEVDENLPPPYSVNGTRTRTQRANISKKAFLDYMDYMAYKPYNPRKP